MTMERSGIGSTSQPSGSATVRVADILPFWRWAVGPTSQHSPAIPHYTRTPAEAFFEEAKRDLPWAGVCLYRRRWFRGVETVREYVPNAANNRAAEGRSRELRDRP